MSLNSSSKEASSSSLPAFLPAVPAAFFVFDFGRSNSSKSGSQSSSSSGFSQSSTSSSTSSSSSSSSDDFLPDVFFALAFPVSSSTSSRSSSSSSICFFGLEAAFFGVS